jgi:short-subunit dehydrogenase
MTANAGGAARRQTALITGASSGIGYELAKLFAQDGYDLVLVARNRPKLEQIAGDFAAKFKVTATAVPEDLSDASAPARIYDDLRRRGVEVDALVNNAGVGTYGFFAESDLAEELAMVQVNVAALTHLTGLFVRDMVKRGRGRILNISSMAGFEPGPLMAIYHASKAYVLSFSEAIANEVKGTGVTVTCLCPGPTATNFQARARMQRSRYAARESMMDAVEVARIGYRGLMAGKSVVIPGLRNQILIWSLRLASRGMVTNVVRKAQEGGG